MPKTVATGRVKFAPPFFDPICDTGGARKPFGIAARDDVGLDRVDDAQTINCNCTSPRSKPSRGRAARGKSLAAPATIATGSHVGYLRRPVTDRTKALDLGQVTLLANAHAYAASPHVKRPLNALLTIVWRHSQRWNGLQSWSRLQSRLMDQLTRWLRRNGIDTAFVWTRETAPGKGAHTHVAIHLGSRPERVRAAMVAWLMSAFAFGPEGIDVSCGTHGAQTEEMRAGMLRYIVKGIDHRMFRYIGFETSNVAAELGIDHRGQQGLIEIKRSGTSQNIGALARQAADWREIRSIASLADVFRPQPQRCG